MDPSSKMENIVERIVRELDKEIDFILHKQTFENLQSVEKCIPVSVEARARGNILLKNESKNGKNIVDKRIISCILTCYTKSIAFAPNDSVELSQAYNNRSIFLHHLKKYDLCIIDCDMALKNCKSEVTRAKILARKVQCMSVIGDQAFDCTYEQARELVDLVSDAEVKKSVKNKLLNFRRSESKTCFRVSKPPNLDIIEKPSKEIPCSSNAVDLKYSKQFGRHLVTNRRVEPGEVLIVEDGYGTFPEMLEHYCVCSFCCNYTFAGIPCENCPNVIYCSDKCRRRALAEYHDLECLLLKINLAVKNVRNNNNLLITRIMIKALKEKSFFGGLNYVLSEAKTVKKCKDKRTKGFKNDKFESGLFRSLYSLQSNEENFGIPLVRTAAHNALNIFRLLIFGFKQLLFYSRGRAFFPLAQFNTEQAKALVVIITRMILILNTNIYSFQSSDCDCMNDVHDQCSRKTLGTIIAACSSLLNHSCSPNTERTFRDGKIIIFAIKPIDKNEQLFCTYGPNIAMPASERQAILKNDYFFTCRCQPCEENWEPYVFSKYCESSKNAFYDWAFQQPSFIDQVGKSEITTKNFNEIITEVIAILKKIYSKNGRFDAEMKSPFYLKCITYMYSSYYGTSLNVIEDIPSI